MAHRLIEAGALVGGPLSKATDQLGPLDDAGPSRAGCNGIYLGAHDETPSLYPDELWLCVTLAGDRITDARIVDASD